MVDIRHSQVIDAVLPRVGAVLMRRQDVDATAASEAVEQAFDEQLAAVLRKAGIQGDLVVWIAGEDVLRSSACCSVLNEVLQHTTHMRSMFADDDAADIVKVLCLRVHVNSRHVGADAASPRSQAMERVATAEAESGTAAPDDDLAVDGGGSRIGHDQRMWNLFARRVRSNLRVVLSTTPTAMSLSTTALQFPGLFASGALSWYGVPLGHAAAGSC